jgi:hypothetical protein
MAAQFLFPLPQGRTGLHPVRIAGGREVQVGSSSRKFSQRTFSVSSSRSRAVSINTKINPCRLSGDGSARVDLNEEIDR